MRMNDNTVLVTGGTSGIGRAIAEAFHERGNRVIVAGRRRELLDKLTTSQHGISGLELDVTDAGSVAALSAELRENFPTINVLIANAGVSRSEDLASGALDISDAEAIVGTNIVGTLRTIAAALPLIRSKPDGILMATTSNLAFVPRSDYPTYCASKAFLHSWLQSLRHQLRGTAVQVLELAPPYVQTELTGEHQLVDPRGVPVDAYVAEVMALLERGDHPRGEVLVERDRERRTAERDGRYEELFARMNPV